jgi:RNA polymerase sigma-70 factor (ECF subfamily)
MDMSKIAAEFTATYDLYADALFRFAYFAVHDREVAKDLVADTFAKVWEYLSKGNAVENIRALCYRTLRNLIVDHWRKHKSMSLDTLLEAGYEPIGADGRIEEEEKADYVALRRAIAALPASYQEVILLRYVEGYSPKEIAELLGITPSLVSVRIFRGQRLLAKRFRI